MLFSTIAVKLRLVISKTNIEDKIGYQKNLRQLHFLKSYKYAILLVNHFTS